MRLLGVIFFCLVFLGVSISYVFYPRIEIKGAGIAPEGLDTHLIRYSTQDQGLDLKEGAAQGIFWSRRRPADKPFLYSICFIHGFTTSRKELSPIIERVGENLGAPIVFTRLSGHGFKDSSRLATARAQDWINDAVECFDTASKIGHRVVLVGMSTGATLATMLAQEYREPEYLVLLSPNFGIKNPFFWLLSGPLGPWVAYLYFGDERKYQEINPLDERYFNTRYPSETVTTLANLLRNFELKKFSETSVPTLMVTSPFDKVVDLDKVRSIAKLQRQGPPIVWMNDERFKKHGLAGDIVDPKQTQLLIEMLSNFIAKTH